MCNPLPQCSVSCYKISPMTFTFRDYIARIWQIRHFWWHLVEADLRARFRRTRLGVLWSILNPLLMTAILTFVFMHVFNESYFEYAAYIFLGFIMWEFYQGTVMLGADSFIKAEGYIKQIKHPNFIYPFKAVLHAVAILASELCGFFVLALIFYPHFISWTWMYLPLFILLLFLFCVPVAVISAIINIQVRDFQQGIGMVTQILWYASPIILKRDVYDQGKLAYWTTVNPFASLLDMFRDPMLYHKAPEQHDIIVVLIAIAVLWTAAIVMLNRHEDRIVFYF